MSKIGLVATSPCRVDLAGGTLDLWPLWHMVKNPMTVNLAVTIHARAKFEPARTPGLITLISEDLGLQEKAKVGTQPEETRLPLLWTLLLGFNEVTGLKLPEQGFTLTTSSDSPPGAGLGGSSALALGVVKGLAAWCQAEVDSEILINLAQGAETRVLKIPTGRQDYYPAAFGGALRLTYGLDRPRPQSIVVDPEWLNRHLVVWYSGASRSSGKANWAMFKRAVEGEGQALATLGSIAQIANVMAEAMVAMDASQVARSLDQEWQLRKSLADEVTCEEFSRVESGLKAMDGITMKACGAGGGGCLVLWMEKPGKNQKQDLVKLLNSCGGKTSRVLPANLETRPCWVTEAE